MLSAIAHPGSFPNSAARILRRRDVESIVGLKRSTIYQAMAEWHFPKPVRLGVRSVGWISTEIENWIAARIAARPGRDVKVAVVRGALEHASR